MKESDFPQFPDPRVREVFAAAANLVEAIDDIPEDQCIEHELWVWKNEELRAALFAAQHSRPKCTCGAPGNHFPDCKQLAAQHSKPKVWPCPTKTGKTCTAAKCDWGCKT